MVTRTTTGQSSLTSVSPSAARASSRPPSPVPSSSSPASVVSLPSSSPSSSVRLSSACHSSSDLPSPDASTIAEPRGAPLPPFFSFALPPPSSAPPAAPSCPRRRRSPLSLPPSSLVSVPSSAVSPLLSSCPVSLTLVPRSCPSSSFSHSSLVLGFDSGGMLSVGDRGLSPSQDVLLLPTPESSPPLSSVPAVVEALSAAPGVSSSSYGTLPNLLATGREEITVTAADAARRRPFALREDGDAGSSSRLPCGVRGKDVERRGGSPEEKKERYRRNASSDHSFTVTVSRGGKGVAGPCQEREEQTETCAPLREPSSLEHVSCSRTSAPVRDGTQATTTTPGAAEVIACRSSCEPGVEISAFFASSLLTTSPPCSSLRLFPSVCFPYPASLVSMQLQGAATSRSASSLEDAAIAGAAPVVGPSLELLCGLHIAQLRFLVSQSCLRHGQSARAGSLTRQTVVSSWPSSSEVSSCSPAASLPSCRSSFSPVLSTTFPRAPCPPEHGPEHARSHPPGDRRLSVILRAAHGESESGRSRSGDFGAGTVGEWPEACLPYSHGVSFFPRDSTAVLIGSARSSGAGLAFHASLLPEAVCQYRHLLASSGAEEREASPSSQRKSCEVETGALPNRGETSSSDRSPDVEEMVPDPRAVSPRYSVARTSSIIGNGSCSPSGLFTSVPSSCAASKDGGDSSLASPRSHSLWAPAIVTPASPKHILSESPARRPEPAEVPGVAISVAGRSFNVSGCPFSWGTSLSSSNLRQCLLSSLLLSTLNGPHAHFARSKPGAASSSLQLRGVDVVGSDERARRLSALGAPRASASLVSRQRSICLTFFPNAFRGPAASPASPSPALAAFTTARQALELLSALAPWPSSVSVAGSHADTQTEKQGVKGKVADRSGDLLSLARRVWVGEGPNSEKQFRAGFVSPPCVAAEASDNVTALSTHSREIVSCRQVHCARGAGGECASVSDEGRGGAAAVLFSSSPGKSEGPSLLESQGSPTISSCSEEAAVGSESTRNGSCCTLACVPDANKVIITEGKARVPCCAVAPRAKGEKEGETVDALVSGQRAASPANERMEGQSSVDEELMAASSGFNATVRRIAAAVPLGECGPAASFPGASSSSAASGHRKREGKNSPVCPPASRSFSVQKSPRWPRTGSQRPVFSYVERHPRLATAAQAAPDEEEEEDKEDVEISICSSEAGVFGTETEVIVKEEGGLAEQGGFSKPHSGPVPDVPGSSSGSHPFPPYSTSKQNLERSSHAGATRSAASGTVSSQEAEGSEAAPSKGSAAASPGGTGGQAAEGNGEETEVTVFRGGEVMTEAERTAAAAEVARIPTVTLTELVRAAVMPLRIEGMHALEQEQLLHGRKTWLRYECPLCDRTVHAPDAYWTNYEHYVRHHWRNRRTLGGYVCFPCRRKVRALREEQMSSSVCYAAVVHFCLVTCRQVRA